MPNLDYLYNKDDAVKDYFGKNYFADRKLGFQTIPHGIIIPHTKTEETDYWGISGVIDEQRRLHKGLNTMQDVTFTMSPDTKIKQSPKTVVYLGLFAPAWGHDITLNLRRLWFLNSETFKTEFKNCQPVYTPWHKYKWFGGGGSVY